MVKCRWYWLSVFLPVVSCASLYRRVAGHRDYLRNADRIGPGLGECGKRIAHPPSSASMDCPMECPYTRPETNNFCSFACVKKEDCGARNPLTSFADPRTRVCSPCAMPGCVTCGNNRTHCLECGDRMVMVQGICVARYGSQWLLLYWVAGIALFVILIYLICLSLRPEVNHARLERAEEYRDFVKLKDMSQEKRSPYEDKSFRLFPITTNLTTENVSGVGIMMHFRWQRYIIVWAIVVVIALYSLSWIPVYSIYPAVGEDTHPNDRDVFQTCAAAGSARLKAEVARADWFYLVITTGIYIFSTLGTGYLLWRQQKVAKEYITKTGKMSDYVVYAKGFPERNGNENLEEEYTKKIEGKLRQAIPDLKVEVVGVSLVWNKAQSGLDIDSQVEHEIGALELAYGVKRKNSRNSRRTIEEQDRLRDLEAAQSRRNCLRAPLCCTCIDNVVLRKPPFPSHQDDSDIADSDTADTLKNMRRHDPDIVDKLKKMRSTGECFVVFKTIEQRNHVVKLKRLHDGDAEIRLTSVRSDPITVLWENYGYQGNGRVLRFIGMCIVLLGCVVLWTVCIYWPYASYVLQWMTAPGVGEERVRDEFFQTTLLTLPIILGNQVMYAVCDKLADRIRCETRGLRDLAYVVLYTVFITFQTVLDIVICISLAYGHHSEDSWKLAQASGVLGPKAIAQNPSIRELLYMELVKYLYPVTLGLCYVLEPILLGVLPYFLFKWLIRSRADIGTIEAQNIFRPFAFDLSRYGDIIISIICCVLICFIASPDVYIVFIWLLGMLLFCYCWDHYRLLRLSEPVVINTNLMDEYCTMMLSVPCALLAACVVFRRYGAHYKDFSRQTIPLACVAAFFAHLVIHICIIRWCIYRNEVELQRQEDEMLAEPDEERQSYEIFAQSTPYNYFNTNWIHCLRSKYIYTRNEKWCYPARHGREYLLKKEKEWNQFYEVPEWSEKIPYSDNYLKLVDTALGRRHVEHDIIMTKQNEEMSLAELWACGEGYDFFHKGLASKFPIRVKQEQMHRHSMMQDVGSMAATVSMAAHEVACSVQRTTSHVKEAAKEAARHTFSPEDSKRNADSSRSYERKKSRSPQAKHIHEPE